jgi:chromosome segregation ATPase
VLFTYRVHVCLQSPLRETIIKPVAQTPAELRAARTKISALESDRTKLQEELSEVTTQVISQDAEITTSVIELEVLKDEHQSEMEEVAQQHKEVLGHTDVKHSVELQAAHEDLAASEKLGQTLKEENAQLKARVSSLEIELAQTKERLGNADDIKASLQALKEV